MAKKQNKYNHSTARNIHGFIVDMSPSTIEDEAMNGGWTNTTRPVGLGTPAKGDNSGMRGEPVMGGNNDFDD